MLEAIRILNFQKHERLEIEFDERVTSIVGPSDAGKSSILRAIRWACTNQPQGGAFIRHGEKEAVVKLKIDGEIVTRRKGTENVYKLGKAEYKAFRGGIPDPIERHLNVSEINFQGQHDPPFWLSCSPGEASRSLNQIVDLDVIDSSLSNVVSELQRARLKVSISSERLKQAEDSKERLDWVVEADEAWTEIERLRKEIDEARRKEIPLLTLKSYILILSKDMEQTVEMNEALGKVIDLGKAVVEGQDRIDRMRSDLSLAREAKASIDEEVPDMSELTSLFDDYRESCLRKASLSDRISDVRDGMEHVSDLRERQVKAKAKLAEAIGEECPLCQRPM